MKNISFWLKFSIFNFFVVAFLGVLMRYKIAYSLPFLEQKNVQEAHSHFAFYGWVTQTIYVLITRYLSEFLKPEKLNKYFVFTALNALAAYLMIPTFIYGGYFWGSIAASVLALFVNFAFFFVLLKDLRNINEISKPWFIGGLFFAVLSSAGIFVLSSMMATGNVSQDLYLASTYYYLHFQYNGFFIFSCIGLLLHSIKYVGAEITSQENKTLFWLMFIGCIIGYGLSVLWMKLPFWIFLLIVAGTVAQTLGAVKLYQIVKKNWKHLVLNFSSMRRFILMFVGFAFFVKILLQLGSNIPAVNQFAFGFRNIVIAYLHLVLLMCISVFLIGQVLGTNIFNYTKNIKTGLQLLVTGIFLNEAVLGLMGIFSIKYIALPYSPQILLGVSVLIAVALLLIFINLKERRKEI